MQRTKKRFATEVDFSNDKKLAQRFQGATQAVRSVKAVYGAAQFIRAERQKWARLVKERNIKAE